MLLFDTNDVFRPCLEKCLPDQLRVARGDENEFDRGLLAQHRLQVFLAKVLRLTELIFEDKNVAPILEVPEPLLTVNRALVS